MTTPVLQGSAAAGCQAARAVCLAMYGFANSSYASVAITALFNAYFMAVVAGNAPWATFHLDRCTFLSSLVVPTVTKCPQRREVWQKGYKSDSV